MVLLEWRKQNSAKQFVIWSTVKTSFSTCSTTIWMNINVFFLFANIEKEPKSFLMDPLLISYSLPITDSSSEQWAVSMSDSKILIMLKGKTLFIMNEKLFFHFIWFSLFTHKKWSHIFTVFKCKFMRDVLTAHIEVEDWNLHFLNN